MANMGSGIVWQSAIGPNTGLPPPNGVFYGNSATTFAEITDGLSNTAFFSERVLADGNDRDHQPDRRRLLLARLAPRRPTTRCADCQAVDINNLANQFPMFMGAPWLDGQHIFLHVTPPNTRSCGFFIVTSGGHARLAAGTPAASTCSSATDRSSSSKTRSISKRGEPWAPGTAARSSVRTVSDRP